MAQKVVLIPGIGEVSLVKRRGTSNLRLSITADGKVRVGLPSWSPYSTGILFAQKRRDWILTQLAKHQPNILKDSDLIGKAHRLHFIETSNSTLTLKSKINPTSIVITTNLDIKSAAVQDKTRSSAEKALKKEADSLLLPRLKQLALAHGYQYSGVKVRKLTSRWGSCSSTKQITLSIYLVQLPWKLIDYVLLHELVHTVHLNHSKDFWSEVNHHLPDYKQCRRAIKLYKPTILPNSQVLMP